MKRLTFFLMLAATLGVLALSVSDLSNALDSPSGVTFLSPSGSISVASDYSNDHIGNWDTGKKEKVYPVRGSKFLKMSGDSVVANEARSSRVKSSFRFSVQGIGTLSFSYRAATYGWNDDVLLFYEDDINDPLLELGGDTWTKKESWDGDVYYDLSAEDFWYEGELILDGDRYVHTITVVVLRGYKDEDYEAPDSSTVVANIAFLDNFVWEADADARICGISPAPKTEEDATFGSQGLPVTILSDYRKDGELMFEYWYTIDGSVPMRNGGSSQKYDEKTGIMLPGTLPAGQVAVRIVAYDGATRIGEYSQTYIRRPSVGTPTVSSAAQEIFTPGISFNLTCEPTYDDVVYYYTLDGTEPTTASLAAIGNTIQAAIPSTVKVIAFADQEQSPETLAIEITQASKPTYNVKADGGTSGNTIFQTQCVVTAQGAGGAKVHCRENGGEAAVYSSARTVTSTTTLEFVTAGAVDSASGVYQLNSLPVAVTVTRETANDGTWATEQVEHFAPNEWSIFAVTRRLSDKRSAELIDWLHPFAYNASRRTLEQATTLQGGAAYLVHSSMIDEAKRPATFADGGGAAPLTGDGNHWVLSSEGAQVIWDGEKWIKNGSEASKSPGWRR